MNNKKMFKKTTLATALISAIVIQQPLWAEEQSSADNNADNDRTLEVIQVTAQKRVQSLQDVPASITTMNGEKLENTGISQMEELSEYVPNFTVTKSGQGYNIFMRGLGSGPNQGFEQTVGTYVDGIYRGRAVLMRSSFLDLEMVEVLRGPQGTLFGMNTTAGALNLTSKNATEEFEASIKGYSVPEFNKQDIEGMVTGALSDNLNARLVAKYEKDDGYITNVMTGKNEPARKNFSGRLTFDWDISDKLNANLKLQHDNDSIKGRKFVTTVEPYIMTAGTVQTEALLAKLKEFELDHKSANTNPTLGEKNADKSNADLITLNLSYDMDNGHSLNAITGWQTYDLSGSKDQDSSPLALIYSPGFSEVYEQFSQELRLTSPGGQKLDYIVGAYFQSSELNYLETSVVYPLGVSAKRDFEQDSDLWAVFGQLDYNIDDKITASMGLRYTEETKDGQRDMALFDFSTDKLLGESALIKPPVLTNALASFGLPGLPGSAYELMLGTQFAYLDPLLLGANSQNIPNPLYGTADNHNLSESRIEKNLTPALTLSYQFDDTAMAYVKGAIGVKSGGFDARSNLGGNFEFEEEEVLSFELGTKLTLDDGAAELNIALFHMSFDDLQTSIFDGQTGFNVKNAGQATTLGLEVDSRWAITDNVMLFGSLGLLNFEWDKFEGAKCFTSNILESDNIDASGKFCDLTGETNAFVPSVTLNLGIEHVAELTGNYLLVTNFDVNYRSEVYTSSDLNPFTKQEAYAKMNVRVAITNDDMWEVALVVKNLTDEITRSFSYDLPFTRGAYSNIVEPGRSIGIQFQYDYF
jgi:iron complex outermembrane receptor protein